MKKRGKTCAALLAIAMSPLFFAESAEAAICALFAFEGGSSIINSATAITGDVCYSNGVTSTTNQKAPKDGVNDGTDDFIGTVRVHSGANFLFTEKNFVPSGGILGAAGTSSEGSQNIFLNDEDANLKALSLSLGASTANTVITDPFILGTGGSLVIDGVDAGTTVVELSQLDLNGATLTLDGSGPFLFNFRNTDETARTFDWSQSTLLLLGGVQPGDIIWNFLDPYTIKVNKEASVFEGTILGPTSSVEYHNPASFNGTINALDIIVHSDFNLNGVPPNVVPIPAALPLFLSALFSLGWIGWRRARTA